MAGRVPAIHVFSSRHCSEDVDARHKAGHEVAMAETVSSEKAELREAALAKRDALPADHRQRGAETIAARAFPVPTAPGMIVSGFMPMRSEINPLPLLRNLAAQGAQLALPVIQGRGKPLLMRAWSFGAPLEARQWGIKEPADDATVVEPDVLIVPLACFDRSGHRIGFGAGYFDKTIRALRAKKAVIAAGVAFAAQEIAHVPATDFDERLDLVLTERDVIDLRGR
jgi:5-formyltetrahydrofolate cyclo-ligase